MAHSGIATSCFRWIAAAFLIGETERSGAIEAMERYREPISDAIDFQYAIASFPDDGKATTELLNLACDQLDFSNLSGGWNGGDSIQTAEA